MQFQISRIVSRINDDAFDELADHSECLGLVLIIGVSKPIALGCARVDLQGGLFSDVGFERLAPRLSSLSRSIAD